MHARSTCMPYDHSNVVVSKAPYCRQPSWERNKLFNSIYKEFDSILGHVGDLETYLWNCGVSKIVQSMLFADNLFCFKRLMKFRQADPNLDQGIYTTGQNWNVRCSEYRKLCDLVVDFRDTPSGAHHWGPAPPPTSLLSQGTSTPPLFASMSRTMIIAPTYIYIYIYIL